MSVMTPALAAAWRLTRDKRYLAQFVRHLRAWFVDPATKMNPNLEYAQAIFGRSPRHRLMLGMYVWKSVTHLWSWVRKRLP